MTIKVLLLYASYGDGHRQVASALTAACENYSDVEVLSEDCFRGTSALISRMSEYLYESLTRFFPAVYGASYTLTRSFGARHPLWRAFSVFSRRAAWRVLKSYEPDVVLQLFPDHALAKLPQGIRVRPILGAVLTDYAVHGRWVHPGLNTVYVPVETLMPGIRRFLTSSQCVITSGIPIRSQFHNTTHQRVPVLLRPYIVIATGGRGVFRELDFVLSVIRQVYPSYEVAVLCGRNEHMLEHVRERSKSWSALHAVGFVENMADWLQFADFAVIKAGGITISECLAMTCPMLFYRPIPGQEAANAAWVEQEGAGIVCRNASAFSSALLLFGHDERTKMRTSATRLAKPEAANLIVAHVVEQVRQLRQ